MLLQQKISLNNLYKICQNMIINNAGRALAHRVFCYGYKYQQIAKLALDWELSTNEYEKMYLIRKIENQINIYEQY